MNEIKEILEFLDYEKGRSWKELKTHFKWSDEKAQMIWNVYFDEKTRKSLNFVIESHRKNDSGTEQIWNLSHNGKQF
jgi:hypothetical protein